MSLTCGSVCTKKCASQNYLKYNTNSRSANYFWGQLTWTIVVNNGPWSWLWEKDKQPLPIKFPKRSIPEQSLLNVIQTSNQPTNHFKHLPTSNQQASNPLLGKQQHHYKTTEARIISYYCHIMPHSKKTPRNNKRQTTKPFSRNSWNQNYTFHVKYRKNCWISLNPAFETEPNFWQR